MHVLFINLQICDVLCRYDLYDWLGFKLQMNLAPEAGVSQGMVDVDLKVPCSTLHILSASTPSRLHVPSCAEDHFCWINFGQAFLTKHCLVEQFLLSASSQFESRAYMYVWQGSDWNGQLKLGNSQFVGANYLQSVTPHLALGGEAFWLGQQRKSGAGFAARYANSAHIATAQIATTGLVSLTYLRRISEKVQPAF